MNDVTKPFDLTIRGDSLAQVLRAVAGLGIHESAITQVGEPWQDPSFGNWVVTLTIDISKARSSSSIGGCY